MNAGFLFAVTLHAQGGLGHSALRAGLMFAPTALIFGAVGLTWRRRPAALQKALVPGGFTTVRREDSADASGLLVTVARLGQLLGVAAFGTLFLNRKTGPAALESAHAQWVCALGRQPRRSWVRRPVSSTKEWRWPHVNAADPLAWSWQNRTAGGDTGQNGRESTMSASSEEADDLLATAEVRVRLSCPSCGSAHVVQVLGDNGGVSYVCTACGHSWS
ncbi:hypothetical protein [Streptomyces sp. ISL-1]|uniref:hypothetical protein n=1 Tax=Streptomyces sp. ISL-1 TaxID=2817657 RepID=UPI0035AC18BF